ALLEVTRERFVIPDQRPKLFEAVDPPPAVPLVGEPQRACHHAEASVATQLGRHSGAPLDDQERKPKCVMPAVGNANRMLARDQLQPAEARLARSQYRSRVQLLFHSAA